jgi:hypothetical protein
MSRAAHSRSEYEKIRRGAAESEARKKRAGKNFPSPDPFPFLPARFGGAGALPPIVAFKFCFKFLFAYAVPSAGLSLTCGLNSARPE